MTPQEIKVAQERLHELGVPRLPEPDPDFEICCEKCSGVVLIEDSIQWQETEYFCKPCCPEPKIDICINCYKGRVTPEGKCPECHACF